MRTGRADRRIDRTRAALRDAFVGLFREVGYGEIAAGDIAARAGVGRSTFYEHYRGKEDLLLKTIRQPFEPLATIVDPVVDDDLLRFALQHFWENRRSARVTTARESSRRAMVRVLTDVLLHRLLRRGETAMTARRRAALIAELLFGVVTGWLAGSVEMTVPELAAALRRCVRPLLEPDRVEDA